MIKHLEWDFALDKTLWRGGCCLKHCREYLSFVTSLVPHWEHVLKAGAFYWMFLLLNLVQKVGPL